MKMKEKNIMKKTITLILALVMLCSVMLTGCGNNVAGTYTFTPNAADVATNTQHAAFLADGVPSQVNTLILDKDGNYSLEKKVDEDTIHLDITFTGAYTVKDGTVTLAVPTDAIWNVDWGTFIEQEYFSGVAAGQLSKGDEKIDCGRNSGNYMGGGHNPLFLFTTPYFLDSEETGEVNVTLNKDGTFSYVEAASTEDD